MAATFDDASTPFDGVYAFDVGSVAPTPTPTPAPVPPTGAGLIGSAELLAPQSIISPGTGQLWSREEAERWIARMGKKPQERIKESRDTENEDEAVALLLTLAILLD